MEINIKRISRFLRVRFAEFKKLIESIKYFGLSSPLIKFRALQLLVYSSVYPIAKVILGVEKSYKICDFLAKSPPFPMIFSCPRLTKSRILIKEGKDLSAVIEIFINDDYQKNNLKNGFNVIDVGAHIGVYTILAAEKIGNTGRVVAIEPEPKNYNRIIENTKLNDFQNVIPVKSALSDHKGFEKLYINHWSTSHSLFMKEEESQFIEIPVNTLDNLLLELNLKKVDIIKIDAEGAEIPILKGAEKTLKNNPEAKIIVASYHYPGETEEVQNFLRNMGFRTKVSPFDIVITA